MSMHSILNRNIHVSCNVDKYIYQLFHNWEMFASINFFFAIASTIEFSIPSIIGHFITFFSREVKLGELLRRQESRPHLVPMIWGTPL